MSDTSSSKGQLVKKISSNHQKPTSTSSSASTAALARAAKPANLPAEPPAELFEPAPADRFAGAIGPSAHLPLLAAPSPQTRPATVTDVAVPGEGHRRGAKAKLASAAGKNADRLRGAKVDYLEAITRYLVWRGHPIKQARTLADVGTALATLRSTRRRKGPRLLLREGFIHATDGFESRSSGVPASTNSAWWENAKAKALLDAMVERRVREALGTAGRRVSARR